MSKEEVRFASQTYANREIKDVLPDGAWEGKPCFIVGGGPSLEGFDFSRLRGRLTIAVNRAYERFEPTVIFGMDESYLRRVITGGYGARARERFRRLNSYRVWLANHPIRFPSYVHIVKVHRSHKDGLRAFTWTLEDGIGHGNNSGFAALNLAVCWRANPVYLLGFDCKFRGGKSHWHSGHLKKKPERVFRGFEKSFRRKAAEIRSHGFRVINLVRNGPEDTAMRCFPIKKIGEVI